MNALVAARPLHKAMAEVNAALLGCDTSALLRALALFKHPALAQLQQLHALRKWHGVLLYAQVSAPARSSPPGHRGRALGWRSIGAPASLIASDDL